MRPIVYCFQSMTISSCHREPSLCGNAPDEVVYGSEIDRTRKGLVSTLMSGLDVLVQHVKREMSVEQKPQTRHARLSMLRKVALRTRVSSSIIRYLMRIVKKIIFDAGGTQSNHGKTTSYHGRFI